jgi:hypothetical protein
MPGSSILGNLSSRALESFSGEKLPYDTRVVDYKGCSPLLSIHSVLPGG